MCHNGSGAMPNASVALSSSRETFSWGELRAFPTYERIQRMQSNAVLIQAGELDETPRRIGSCDSKSYAFGNAK